MQLDQEQQDVPQNILHLPQLPEDLGEEEVEIPVQFSHFRTQQQQLDGLEEAHNADPEPQAIPQAEIGPQENSRQQRAQVFTACQFPPAVEPYTIGIMNGHCNYCGALQFRNEKINCFHNGKVELPPIGPYPHEFKDFLTSNNAVSHHFLENIRQYNSSMAFAYFVANDLGPLQGRGPYTFRLHGQVYHMAGTLHPPEGKPHTYGQLYIIEGDQAVEMRLSHRENQHCRRKIVTLLTTVL